MGFVPLYPSYGDSIAGWVGRRSASEAKPITSANPSPPRCPSDSHAIWHAQPNGWQAGTRLARGRYVPSPHGPIRVEPPRQHQQQRESHACKDSPASRRCSAFRPWPCWWPAPPRPGPTSSTPTRTPTSMPTWKRCSASSTARRTTPPPAPSRRVPPAGARATSSTASAATRAWAAPVPATAHSTCSAPPPGEMATRRASPTVTNAPPRSRTPTWAGAPAPCSRPWARTASTSPSAARTSRWATAS